MAPNPLLRAMVRVERSAAGTVNRATNSGQAADLMLLGGRVIRTVGGVTDRVRSVAVHTLALPSHRDVQLLEAKVERLQRTIDELAASRDDEPPS